MNIRRFASIVALLAALPATAKAGPPGWGAETGLDCAFSGIAEFNWGANVIYQDCIGAFTGNTSGSFVDGVLAKLDAAWGTPWSQIEAIDSDGFNTTTGKLTFTDFISGQFAIALKQGNGFALYLFIATDPVKEMFYTTAGVKNGATTGLSHANLYTGPQVELNCVGLQCIESTVPEPSTYALMAAGLAALAFATRRRRQIS